MTKLLQKVERNTLGRDFVVGDIHGCYNLLCKGLIDIEFDFKKDRLFAVGDLVDRGLQNMEVLRFFQRKAQLYTVLGNHESMMMDYVSPGLGSNGEVWKRNGGDWYDRLTGSEEDELNLLVEWIYKMVPYVIEIDHERGPVFISHATPLSEYTDIKMGANKESLIWDRSTLYWARAKSQNETKMNDRFQHITYHGHTPLKSVFKAGNSTWLDTGAFATENLTILEI
jgi:serine/threonine protein phosphatase 1